MKIKIRSREDLPLDILCNIFVYYDETPEAPLETLLLVCRLWNEAALKSYSIWSDINIRITDGPTALFCTRNLSRRLSRSGRTSPIYFSLEAV